MRITNDINEANMITHSGVFHVDEVFSTAFLSKLIKDPIIYRINNFDKNIKTDAIIDAIVMVSHYI